jgi:hypothetical protein
MQRANIYSKFGLAEPAKKLGFLSKAINLTLENDPYQKIVFELVYCILLTQQPVDIQTRMQLIARRLRKLVGMLGNTAVELSTPYSTVAWLNEPRSRRCRLSASAPSGDSIGIDSDDLKHIFLIDTALCARRIRAS